VACWDDWQVVDDKAGFKGCGLWEGSGAVCLCLDRSAHELCMLPAQQQQLSASTPGWVGAIRWHLVGGICWGSCLALAAAKAGS
jgi:hypothetical protein